MESKVEEKVQVHSGIPVTTDSGVDDANVNAKESDDRSVTSRSEGVDGVDDDDETFDVVDERNEVVGRASRRRCHEEGLMHRSTHVFLFRQRQPIGRSRPRVEVLLQKRSEHKKVGAGLWDVSVAEHLSPGEDYRSATERGLREELTLNLPAEELVQIRQTYLSRQLYEEAGVLDNMFTATFAALYDPRVHGPVQVDGQEVESIEWWHVPDVVVKAKQHDADQTFTRWLLIELRNLDLAEIGNMVTGAI